jgi:hypothetical protein
MEITTRDLQAFVDLRKKIDSIDAEISARRTAKGVLEQQYQEMEQKFITQLDRGVIVNSKKFLVTVKEHAVQAYINWQKEYRANHPKEYEALKEERGKDTFRELQVAERVM